MFEYFLSSWRSGLRSRGFFAILLLGVLLMGVAILASAFSPRQPATVAMDVGLSGVRFCLVIFGLYWVQELVAKEISQRTVVFALAFPVSRPTYLAGRFGGMVALLAMSAVFLGILLRIAVQIAGANYDQSFPVSAGGALALSIFGLWVDAVVVTSFAFLIASLATVEMLPLVLGLAFAVAGKGLGATVEYLLRGADGDVGLTDRYLPLIEIVQWVIPDLSRLDWRSFPMYGTEISPDYMMTAVAAAVGYTLLALSLAAAAFERRELG